MDVQEKLVDSHKSISRIIATLLILIFVLSVYVIQRALVIVGASPDLLRALTSNHAVQISFFNLGFSYTTMTVLWPAVLGGLCLIYALLDRKRTLIERSHTSRRNAMQNCDIVEVDPFYISAPLFRSGVTRTAAHLFALFPMIAIVTHVLMLAMWVVMMGLHPYRLARLLGDGFVRVPTGAVFSLSSTLFSVVGFLGALSFWKTVRESVNGSKLSEDKHEPAQQGAAPDAQNDVPR